MTGFGDISIRAFLARFMGYQNRRKLWQAFGYPNIITAADYWDAYKRNGIANRIVKSYPNACWRDGTTVNDDDGSDMDKDSDDYSEFAAAWYELQKANKIYHYLERADRMARVGQFSILVMGFADNSRMSTPLVGEAELRYMNAYAEKSVTITQWDTDPESERFGLPVLYRVQVDNQNDPGSKQVTPNASFVVHFSRVIHVVENPDDTEIFGEPALRPVWNYVIDLEKVTGSSSETFWLNARGGMSIEAAADAKLTAEGIQAMKEQVEEYENQLRRVIAIQGAKVNAIATTVASPQANAELLFSLISGATGIPQRILFGSERGELASSEDANSWESRVDERRQNHCGPMILIPFINRMIETGNMPEPSGDWWAVWPEASAASPEKQADIAVKRTNALVAYANSAADQIVGPTEFRPWIGLEPVPDAGVIEEDDDEDTLGLGEDEEEEAEEEVVEDPEAEEEEDDEV
jgi:hypothetical protein